MKKLVMLAAGAVASGAMAMGANAMFGSSVAASDPGGSNAMNVVGESYARAVSILKSQGVKATFGGSVGSDVPQAQCIVDQEKMGSHGRVILMLNCTTKAVENAQDSAPASGGAPGGAPQGPRVGSNGVTTVQATPVGPQPGMTIPGM
ncbi:hypothetical protein FZI85_05330 [Mycobacterium sp. CBMA293]|uniref:hypothetical protein n=1 Tax=unclassified Mycolicibacterium TaxID=2636767 RepID=UPI0013259673|nr:MULTISPECIES: hypothetical protein [unclassified Mycolicibacterium]MUL49172.1 hypothetical protein [Mycolicibacterium sp. CBMA 360]MUL93577.1 hypothetical protein [Mycolicibacterium sp. CBMA 230]MUM35468.1 hypothetical protein [Mycolicibacterium sp. CBMA 361]MUL62161.1 hypothetical protein [Mycolicibacterium sp. CBMA 335]MUL71622.1 hypothetical protein [Mycolicibacterium sp. CBMA 311]